MTNPATPEIRVFAERLLANEVVAGKPSRANIPAAFRVSEKLRRPLTAVAGAAGFRSLLLRALTLAKREAPSLSKVQVNPDGSLAGPGEIEGPQVEVLLIAQLIGLLFIFIGEDLTLRLLREVWPDASLTTSRKDDQT